jgi:AmpD protein
MNNILISDNWLRDVRIISSPNWDQRPIGTKIDLLVIHSISLPPGEFGGEWINDLFQNSLNTKAHPAFAALSGLKVSAHLLIRRDGEIIQYVPLAARAWHAGVSQFQGRDKCNDFSVGIELEGCDTIPFTTIQYTKLVQLTRIIQKIYPAITLERIVGHNQIAPGRKTDPGPLFDWKRYTQKLNSN